MERTHDRIFVHGAPTEALEVLSNIFGLQSISAALRTSDSTLPDIVRTGVRLFAPLVNEQSFAVRARFVGERSPVRFSSGDLERELGTALLPYGSRVDLSNPDITARIEIHQNTAYFIGDSREGTGGLPLGTGGRALALISGGFDSAVAAWQIMRRGSNIDFLFCNLGGHEHAIGTLSVLKILADNWFYGYQPRLHILDFQPVVEALQNHTDPRFWQVLLKRAMFQAAHVIAEECNLNAIITGEVVGQVSSQTLQNLSVISNATDYLILRPLIGTNKNDIINIARKIGTESASAKVQEYCALNARDPSTATQMHQVKEEERALPNNLISDVLTLQQSIDLRTTRLDTQQTNGLALSSVPENTVVIDLRTRALFDQWHYPDALWLEFSQAIRTSQFFATDRSYVLYCEFGILAAQLAEQLHDLGHNVFYIKGGIHALKRKNNLA